MEEEIWKDVPNYEGYYRCSNLGRVISVERAVFNGDGLFLRTANKRFLKHGTDRGYHFVVLYKNFIKKTIQIHQLVAICFLGHTPCGHDLVVDHINGDRGNNAIYNLRIVTNRQNATTCFRSLKFKPTSNFVGVSWDKNAGKWTTRMHVKSKDTYLGLFSTEIEASNAYQNALLKL